MTEPHPNPEPDQIIRAPIAANNKRQNFVRLAEARVDMALDRIRRINKLANRQTYTFDERDVEKIIGALTKAIEDMRRRFEDPDAKQASFKL